MSAIWTWYRTDISDNVLENSPLATISHSFAVPAPESIQRVILRIVAQGDFTIEQIDDFSPVLPHYISADAWTTPDNTPGNFWVGNASMVLTVDRYQTKSGHYASYGAESQAFPLGFDMELRRSPTVPPAADRLLGYDIVLATPYLVGPYSHYLPPVTVAQTFHYLTSQPGPTTPGP